MKFVVSTITSALAALAIWPMMAAPAQAHAYLLDSFPAANQSLHAPPKAVKLWFTGRADAHYSTVNLLDEGGTVLATHTQPVAKREIELAAPSLQPGRYRVEYRVLSTDGDIVQGRLNFAIEQ